MRYCFWLVPEILVTDLDVWILRNVDAFEKKKIVCRFLSKDRLEYCYLIWFMAIRFKNFNIDRFRLLNWPIEDVQMRLLKARRWAGVAWFDSGWFRHTYQWLIINNRLDLNLLLQARRWARVTNTGSCTPCISLHCFDQPASRNLWSGKTLYSVLSLFR